MTPHEKTIILKGIEEAARTRVGNMFDVLMAESSSPNEAFKRFEAGLDKLILTWHKATSLVEKDSQ